MQRRCSSYSHRNVKFTDRPAKIMKPLKFPFKTGGASERETSLLVSHFIPSPEFLQCLAFIGLFSFTSPTSKLISSWCPPDHQGIEYFITVRCKATAKHPNSCSLASCWGCFIIIVVGLAAGVLRRRLIHVYFRFRNEFTSTISHQPLLAHFRLVLISAVTRHHNTTSYTSFGSGSNRRPSTTPPRSPGRYPLAPNFNVPLFPWSEELSIDIFE